MRCIYVVACSCTSFIVITLNYSIMKCSTSSHFYCQWTFWLFGVVLKGAAADFLVDVSSYTCACHFCWVSTHRVMFRFIRSCQFSIFTPFPYIYSLSSHVSLLMQVCYPLWTGEKTRAQKGSVSSSRSQSQWVAEPGYELEFVWLHCLCSHHMVSSVVPLQYYLSVNAFRTQPGGVNRAALCFPGTF